LRAPNGCPWDREQTHQSLRTYLIEEAYEVLEALESGNDDKFVKRWATALADCFSFADRRRRRPFTVAEVIREIHDKMIRRHPHVFGKTRARDSAEVLRNWEQIKAEERRASGKKSDSNGGGKHQKKLLCSMASLTHCPQRWKAFSSLAKLPELVLTGTTQGDFRENAGRIGRVKEGLGRARPAENRRGAGRLALRRRKPLTIFEDRPGNRPQEGQREILSPIPRHGGAGPENGREFKDLPREEMEAFWDAGKKSEGKPRLPEKS